MPLYEFEDSKGKIVTLVFVSKDAPKVGETIVVKRKKLTRIFSLPQVSFDVKVDPFNEGQFVRKTGSVKGDKMGDIWARSEELSEKRAAKAGGRDPIKEQYLKDYSAKRKGKPHPTADKNKTYTI